MACGGRAGRLISGSRFEGRWRAAVKSLLVPCYSMQDHHLSARRTAEETFRLLDASSGSAGGVSMGAMMAPGIGFRSPPHDKVSPA